MIIISDKIEFVKSDYKKDMQSELFGWEGPVPGSASEIAARHRDSERKKELQNIEKTLVDMEDDFPQLKNIYDILRKGK